MIAECCREKMKKLMDVVSPGRRALRRRYDEIYVRVPVGREGVAP
jgi:hypothetical protein